MSGCLKREREMVRVRYRWGQRHRNLSCFTSTQLSYNEFLTYFLSYHTFHIFKLFHTYPICPIIFSSYLICHIMPFTKKSNSFVISFSCRSYHTFIYILFYHNFCISNPTCHIIPFFYLTHNKDGFKPFQRHILSGLEMRTCL